MNDTAVLELQGDVNSDEAKANAAEQARREKNKGTLILHCGGRIVQVDDLRGFVAPTAIFGSKYHPYEHHLFMSDVEDQVRKMLGDAVIWDRQVAVKDTNWYPREEYEDEKGVTRSRRIDGKPAVNIPGGQMFGLLKIDLGEDHGCGIEQLLDNALIDEATAQKMNQGDMIVPSLGLRNSIDQSMSAGVMYGNHTFICDNLAFSGSNVFVHKHTKNAAANLITELREMLRSVPQNFKLDLKFRKLLQETPLTDDEMYAIIGQLIGHKLLLPVQSSLTWSELRKPSFECFEKKTGWSLFNHVTFAKKRGNAKDNMDALEKITKFFQEKVLDNRWHEAKHLIVEGDEKTMIVDMQPDPAPMPNEVHGDYDGADVNDDDNFEDPNLAFNGGYEE